MIKGISAFLNVNKPSGITSFKVVKHLSDMLNVRAGHLGTLDPLATGVLLVAIGSATRLSQFFMKKTKRYEFVIKFGAFTDTLDEEGKITQRVEKFELVKDKIENAITPFLGHIRQIPPRYSAIKYKGRKLYEYSRKNQAIDILQFEREVDIFDLKLLSIGSDEAAFYSKVGSGTYIRSLAFDICSKLGIPGHILKINRLSIGDFEWAQIENSVDFKALNSAEDVLRHLIPLKKITEYFNKIKLDGHLISKLLNGQYISLNNFMPFPQPVLIVNDADEIVGIGSSAYDKLHLDRVL